MMYRISKDFAFSASHRLDGLPPEHQCSRLHGHNYVVRIVVQAEVLDATGFVVDYGELAPVKAIIDGTFDHRHLNDIMAENPTAENLARWFHDATVEALNIEATGTMHVEVGVSETPKTWAWYVP